jgi:hypothetical protein
MLLAAGVLVAGCDEEATAPAPAPAAGAAAPRLSPKQVKDCRDQCEQSLIAASGHADDAPLRACRTSCTAAGSGAGPHEVPSRITVAPADHARSRPPPPR